MTTARGSDGRFTALDWIGTAVTLLAALGLLYFPIAGRTFAGMFADFGGARPLPTLTALAISWWFPLALGLATGGGVALGLRRASTLGRRRAWIVGAFLFAGLGLTLCLIGAYLPVFELADKIKAG
jgi:hypothetical protein